MTSRGHVTVMMLLLGWLTPPPSQAAQTSTNSLVERPPSDIIFVQDKMEISMTDTFDKANCIDGCCTGNTYFNNTLYDYELRDKEARVLYDQDFGAASNAYLNEIPNSSSGKWCWNTYLLYDLYKYQWDILLIFPTFNQYENKRWWPRNFEKINGKKLPVNGQPPEQQENYDVDEEGTIVVVNQQVLKMSANGNMKTKATFNGSHFTSTVAFKHFLCAYTGKWQIRDGDYATKEDYKIYEIYTREVVRTEYEENTVKQGAKLTLKFKPGYSERIVCEIESTANANYEWVWYYKTQKMEENGEDFKEISERLFEVKPYTEKKGLGIEAATTEAENGWKKRKRKEADSEDKFCTLQRTTGRMSINMDRDEFNRAQVQCRLVHKFNETKTYRMRTYTMTLRYDNQKAAEEGLYTEVENCLVYQLSFGGLTLITFAIWSIAVKTYKKRGAFYKEKWRHTRIPPVDPDTFQKLLKRHIRDLKKKSSVGQGKKDKSIASDANSDAQSKAKSDTNRSCNTAGDLNRSCTPDDEVDSLTAAEDNKTLQKKRNRVQSSSSRSSSSTDSWEDMEPSEFMVPEWESDYKYSAQYYADLKAAMLDTDQSYDDRSATLRTRHAGSYEELVNPGLKHRRFNGQFGSDKSD